MATRKTPGKTPSNLSTRKADATARRQRAIQKPIDARDARKPASKKDEDKKPVQAGARRQPTKVPADRGRLRCHPSWQARRRVPGC